MARRNGVRARGTHSVGSLGTELALLGDIPPLLPRGDNPRTVEASGQPLSALRGDPVGEKA